MKIGINLTKLTALLLVQTKLEVFGMAIDIRILSIISGEHTSTNHSDKENGRIGSHSNNPDSEARQDEEQCRRKRPEPDMEVVGEGRSPPRGWTRRSLLEASQPNPKP